MRVTVERKALTDAVTFAARALPRNSPVPVLHGMRLTGGRALTVSAFDFETYAHAQVLNTADDGDVDVLVPGMALRSYLAGMTGPAVTLDVDEHTVTVRAGRSSASLQTMSLRDYPSAPTPPPLVGQVDAAAFAATATAVAAAADPNNALPALRGVAFTPGDTLTLAATDRYRGHLAEIPWTRADNPRNTPALAAVGALDAARFLVSQVLIGCDDTLLSLGDGHRLIVTRLLSADPPQLHRLFPDNTRRQATVDREEFIDALRFVIAGDTRRAETVGQITLDVSTDAITVRLRGLEGVTAEASVDAKVDGDPLTAHFRALYLQGAAGAFTADTICIGQDVATKPALITAEEQPDLRCLVMPVRA